MPVPLRVLMVEDSEDDALLFIVELQRAGYEVTYRRVETEPDMNAALKAETWDLVLSDHVMPSFNGLGALRVLKESGLDLPFILVSGKIGEEAAVEVMQAGAHDYIQKGRLLRLAPAIERELQEAKSRRQRRVAERALQESEETLRTLIDANPEALMLTDIQGKVLAANETAAQSLGKSLPELLGSCFLTLLPPEVAETRKARLEEAISSGKPVHFEDTRAGRYFNNCINPIFDLEGKVAKLAILVRDISERKRAEENLHLRNRIANIFLTIPNDEMYGEVLQVVLEVMDSAYGVFGYVDEERTLVCPSMSRDIWEKCQVPGKTIRFPWETWGDTIWGRAFSEKRTLCSNEPRMVPEGHVPIHRVLVVPILFQGEVIGHLVVANKATDYDVRDQEKLEAIAGNIAPVFQAQLQRDRENAARRRAEEAQAAERQRFYDVLEMLPVFVVLLTPDYHVAFANKEFRERFGESHGRRCFEFIFGRTEPCELCEINTVLKTRKPHEWEWTGPNSRDYHIYDYFFTDVDGSPLILEMGIDLTDRKQAEAAVLESEKKYRTLVETTDTGYLILDSQGKVADANQEYVRLTGHISLEEILGRSVVEWTSEHDRERNAAEVIKCLQQGYVRGLEIDYVDKEGRITPIEINATVITTGQSLQIVSLCRDITERRKSLVRLECINQLKEDLLLSPRFTDRLKHVTDGVVEIFAADFARIWITKPGDLCDSGCLHAKTQEASAICSRDICLHLVASSGRYTDIDSASHRRVPLGCYKIGRVATGEDNKFLTNDVTQDPKIHDHEWARSLGLAAFAGYRLLSPEKKILGVLALFSKHPISSEEDAMLEGIAGTTAQVIRMGEAEEKLRESEQRFRAMFERAADAILLADIDTKKFLMGNEMSSKLLGYSLDEIRQLGVMDIHPPEALPYVLEQFERQVKDEIVVAQVLPVQRKDGSVFYADVNAFPVIIEGKIYLMGVFQDITERRQAVQALEETNAKLEIMVSEVNQRNYKTTIITGMSESLQSCLNFDEAYPIIAHSVQQLFAAVSGGLFLLDPAGNFLEVVTSWGETLAGEPVFPPNNCWAIRRSRIHLSGGCAQNERCRHLPDKAGGCYFCLPLVAQEGTFGLLHLQAPGEAESSVIDQVKDLAVTVADNISLTLANLKLRESLRQQVIHDPLTGLFNRRYLDETLEREIHRVRRKKSTLGVIMMDLDYFKHFNDTYGHEAGDSLLEALGSFLKTQVRVEDIACRYGGEEFVLIMPEASFDIAQQRAEEIRREVPHLQVVNRGRLLESTTISLGVAIFPNHGATGQDVLRAADDAMYQAKAAGRNRVVVAGSSVEPNSVVE